MSFELKIDDKVATFRKPGITDIEAYFEEKFNNVNDFICVKHLLSALYKDGDKDFIEDEDFIINIEEKIIDLIDYVVGSYKIEDLGKQIKINYNEKEVILNKMTFKHNRILRQESSEKNFSFIQKFKEFVFELLDSKEHIPVLIKDTKLMLISIMVLAANLKVKDIEIKYNF